MEEISLVKMLSTDGMSLVSSSSFPELHYGFGLGQEERILKVTKKSGNRERCRKLSLWNRTCNSWIHRTFPRPNSIEDFLITANRGAVGSWRSQEIESPKGIKVSILWSYLDITLLFSYYLYLIFHLFSFIFFLRPQDKPSGYKWFPLPSLWDQPLVGKQSSMKGSSSTSSPSTGLTRLWSLATLGIAFFLWVGSSLRTGFEEPISTNRTALIINCGSNLVQTHSSKDWLCLRQLSWNLEPLDIFSSQLHR